MTVFRFEPVRADVERVERLTRVTGFFNPDEVRIAAELVGERLAKGKTSGYEFVFVDSAPAADGGSGELLAYSCYGPIDGTLRSWDLFWIAVQPHAQGRGLGREVLRETERRIALAGGGLVWVETGGKTLYQPTRSFYERCGYVQQAALRDFYAPGDAKIVYLREIAAADR
ncbi:MAG: GNAT family N-acetyltransferase [Planctomycetes bacterium]|nr:GNAT family N-acetyltransferase [Planctomycetota bacterium]